MFYRMCTRVIYVFIYSCTSYDRTDVGLYQISINLFAIDSYENLMEKAFSVFPELSDFSFCNSDCCEYLKKKCVNSIQSFSSDVHTNEQRLICSYTNLCLNLSIVKKKKYYNRKKIQGRRTRYCRVRKCRPKFSPIKCTYSTTVKF